MKKILNKWLDKVPILKYILSSFVKCFIISVPVLGIIFAVLSFTGVYSKLESILDLKYNSPFVLVPMFTFIALAVLCFFIGFLMYFHKYKRTKSKSKFREALSDILDSK